MESSKRGFPFLSLPPELREEVYRYLESPKSATLHLLPGELPQYDWRCDGVLCTNHQLAGEVRAFIARNVRHTVHLYKNHIGSKVNYEDYPALAHLEQVRSVQVKYAGNFQQNKIKRGIAENPITFTKRLAKMMRFMPHTRRASFNIGYSSSTHSWLNIGEEVKSSIVLIFAKKCPQLQRLRVKLEGRFCNRGSLWPRDVKVDLLLKKVSDDEDEQERWHDRETGKIFTGAQKAVR